MKTKSNKNTCELTGFSKSSNEKLTGAFIFSSAKMVTVKERQQYGNNAAMRNKIQTKMSNEAIDKQLDILRNEWQRIR